MVVDSGDKGRFFGTYDFDLPRVEAHLLIELPAYTPELYKRNHSSLRYVGPIKVVGLAEGYFEAARNAERARCRTEYDKLAKQWAKEDFDALPLGYITKVEAPRQVPVRCYQDMCTLQGTYRYQGVSLQ